MKTVKFEDKGQDFLEWIIKDGIIIDCQPFQFDFWVGKKVKIDNDIASIERQGEWRTINYKVISVEPTYSEYVDGHADGVQGTVDKLRYESSKQYKFGYLVSTKSIKGRG